MALRSLIVPLTLGSIIGVAVTLTAQRCRRPAKEASAFVPVTIDKSGKSLEQLSQEKRPKRGDISPEESAKLHWKEHQEAIAKHDQEPVDATWAPVSEKSLQEGLKDVAKRVKFTAKKVECKTASCIAVLEWPSYAAAKASWSQFLSEPYQLPCGRAIMLPDEKTVSPSSPVDATLIFDCKRDQPTAAK